MAASDKVYSVKLSEDDVPGAKFKSNVIEEHSVFELKRWLECRGLPTTGNKSTLLERCKSCIDASEKDNIIVSIDGGKWFQKKVSTFLSTSNLTRVKIPVLPATGWKPFPSQPVPDSFCYGQIYEHIISTAKVYQPDDVEDGISDFNTEKPMKKGRQYFLSGHVKEMQDTRSGGCYFVKCKVMASYDLKTSYFVTVTLHSEEGNVLDASCECRASALSRCNHVAALLFALEDYTVQFGNDPLSCTSKLCSWNIGRKTKRDPKPCHQSESRSKKLKMDRIIKHDPRPENLIPENKDFVNNFIANLPTAGLTMFGQILEISYGDYDVDKESLRRMTNEAINNLKIVSNKPVEIEGTLEQSASDAWHQARRLRVTATNAKTLSVVKSRRQQYTLLKNKLWSDNNAVAKLKAVKYGREHENEAFCQYERELLRTGEKLTKSGFWVNPEMPELGCSPDGVLRDDSQHVRGIIEIKCPYILEHFNPLDVENIPNQRAKNLCYRVVNGNVQLKRSHSYYFQVQMQLAVCDVDFCDFVVWSPKGIAVERITKDIELWTDLKPKLLDFHHNVLVPEYFEMRVPRRLLPVSLL